MRTELSAAVRAAMVEALASAGHGERTATARRLAEVYGVSVATVYRVAGRGGTARRRTPKNPEYREWTRLAVALAHRAPEATALDLAIRAGVESGLLPPEAAAMPTATAHRLAREMGLVVRKKRTHRLHADYPMQAVQMDGSTSQYLVVDRELEDGDWLLRLHRRPAPQRPGGYKNKPLGRERLRVLVYGLWDMCTGYTRAVYVVGKGESALDAMTALCAMLAETGEGRRPLHGVPEDLWSDQGPLFKSGAARDLLERLDVNLVTGEAYAKERMGGVERSHRTRWARFERALFLRGRETILLSELNERLCEYEAEENGRRSSRTPVGGRAASRTEAWVALTNGRPADNPLRKLPDNPVETLAREARRKVDVNGVVRWGGAEYEAERWHDRWVIARRGMDGSGSLVLEDERTGERCVAAPCRPRPYGEVRAVEKTALERLREEGAADRAAADLYAPGGDAGGARVTPMRARTAPAAALENPLDGERYRSLAEAMRAFTGIYPHRLSDSHRALVRAQIEDAGLGKAAVAELALEMTGLAQG